jgi:pyridoxine 4-dehydrogenase
MGLLYVLYCMRREGESLKRRYVASGDSIPSTQHLMPIAAVALESDFDLAHRADNAFVDDFAGDGVAYVPFFPLGRFTPLQSDILFDVATRLGATPMQIALAWLLQRSPNILVIPGTSSIKHLRENLRWSMLQLPTEVIADLDAFGGNA